MIRITLQITDHTNRPHQPTTMNAKITTITEAAKTFAAQHWPESGQIWVRVDMWGNGLGYTSQGMPECAARACREEVAIAKKQWLAAAVGDFVTIPSGYHPRHGIKTATYCRVR